MDSVNHHDHDDPLHPSLNQNTDTDQSENQNTPSNSTPNDDTTNNNNLSPEARVSWQEKVRSGLLIHWMKMSEGGGPTLWTSEDWGRKSSRELWDSDAEFVARVPSKILQCSSVSREINFSCVQKLDQFRIRQIVLLREIPIEEWNFKFGFVIPNSTNTWESTIEAAKEMLPVELLSGNIVIQTEFYDGELFLCENKLRVYYI